MLNDIRLQLCSDEQLQSRNEAAVSSQIQQNQREGINAFKRYIPSLLPYVFAQVKSNISIFCNKAKELNIVDYNSGQTFYGDKPLREVTAQVDKVAKQADLVNFNTGQWAQRALPLSLDALVVFGLGAGYHIQQLIERHTIKHMIIYEPQHQYLKCSMSMLSWQNVLRLAQKKGTALYFQLEEDGRNVQQDLAELRQNTQANECYFYKHYNHIVFDALLTQIQQHGLFSISGLSLYALEKESVGDLSPRWSVPLDSDAWTATQLSQERFNKNLSAFKKFFNDIYEEFADYEPECWLPRANANAEVNLFHKVKNINLYGDSPLQECRNSFEFFASHPHKDALATGTGGEKKRHFFHYQLVSKVEPLLKKLEDKHAELPEKVRSLIIFGLGIGYQFELLSNAYTLDKLFICEPNRDLFYASLYALDWHTILHRIDEQGGSLYLNIGDDGTHTFHELVTQFQVVGPYVLANTFFYQAYYNENLVNAIAQLREQLQVLIAMGDYFDHSRHLVAHTRQAILDGIPHLRDEPVQYLSQAEKNVPVFIVGNGPSLDGLIDTLKEYQESAIIISCGTALQSLYRHGITPDFHAEIEANRSPYDWISRGADLAFLKQVSLISCNGIHPDISNLFKDVYLTFKPGESGTTAVQRLYDNFPFALTKNAYPTVTNFVMAFASQFRFSQLYLLGVDLGFVDEKHHHSKASGYYMSDGKEQYEYSKVHNTSLRVAGNFRPFVNTKYEFKLAKEILERAVKDCDEVYNLSDGAKFEGTRPLYKEDTLILSTPEIKQICLSSIKSKCFEHLDADEFQTRFNAQYRQDDLSKGFQRLMTLTKREVESVEDVEELIETQRKVILLSVKGSHSLLYFYLNGSLNFVNSALTKIVSVDDEKLALTVASEVLSLWHESLNTFLVSVTTEPYAFDSVYAFYDTRQDVVFPQYIASNQIKYTAADSALKDMLKAALNYWDIANALADDDFNVVITQNIEHIESAVKRGVTRVYLHTNKAPPAAPVLTQSNVITLYCPANKIADYNNLYYGCLLAVAAATLQCGTCIVVPKLPAGESALAADNLYDLTFLDDYYAYDLPMFFIFSIEPIAEAKKLIGLGDRARFVPHFTPELLVATEMPAKLLQEVFSEQSTSLNENKK